MVTYGFAIEFKNIKYEKQQWENHWNHKVYKTEKYAEEAVEQMKRAYKFYREDYEWRIIEIFTRITTKTENY